MQIQREETGEFALKGDEPRILRSMRLTDTCWDRLGEVAKSLNCSRSDLIEATVEDGCYSEEKQEEKDDIRQEIIAEIEALIDSFEPGEEPELELSNHRDRAPARRILRALVDHLS